MNDLRARTPEEFGRALQALREARGVSLEAIASKTKISPLVLNALEAGQLARLPGLVFGRMFLRQYLTLLGEEPGPWVTVFEVLWKKWESSSQPLPVVPVEAVKPRAWVRWVLGFLLVGGAIVAVFYLERSQNAPLAGGQPTPRAILEKLAPTPEPAAAVAVVPEVEPQEGSTLLLETTRPCWVEWAPEGGPGLRQLVGAGQRLELRVPEGGGELLLGDAGAVSLRLRDAILAPPGRDGQVLRLRVPWAVGEGKNP